MADTDKKQDVIAESPIKGAPPVADCPPNTVQLFQFARGTLAPSPSPFVLKVETYLRLAKIPYENDLYMRFSPTTGKIPWIRYNGTAISDSTLIIDFLNKECGVDLNTGMSARDRAVCTAFERMVDEHLFWVLVYAKWQTEGGLATVMASISDMDPAVRETLPDSCKDMLHKQGMGRHPEDTILDFCKTAMAALDDLLGDNLFMMGAEPTQLDCSVFGMLAEFLWYTKDEWSDKVIPEHFPRLQAYCERVKARAWPDWDDCTTKFTRS